MGVTLKGQLICKNEGEAALVRAALDEHISLTRAEPGCLSFDVTQSDDPLIWDVAEEFTDPAAFEAHQARTRASDWGERTKGITRMYLVKGMP